MSLPGVRVMNGVSKASKEDRGASGFCIQSSCPNHLASPFLPVQRYIFLFLFVCCECCKSFFASTKLMFAFVCLFVCCGCCKLVVLQGEESASLFAFFFAFSKHCVLILYLWFPQQSWKGKSPYHFPFWFHSKKGKSTSLIKTKDL